MLLCSLRGRRIAQEVDTLGGRQRISSKHTWVRIHSDHENGNDGSDGYLGENILVLALVQSRGVYSLLPLSSESLRTSGESNNK